MINTYSTIVTLLLYEMLDNFYVVYSIMVNWVPCNVDGSFIVTI